MTHKRRDNLDSESRLNKMLSILDGKQITTDMIALDLLEAFIYQIIIVDRKNIVITIDAFNSLSLEDLRAQRKEVAKGSLFIKTKLESETLKGPLNSITKSCLFKKKAKKSAKIQ